MSGYAPFGYIQSTKKPNATIHIYLDGAKLMSGRGYFATTKCGITFKNTDKETTFKTMKTLTGTTPVCKRCTR